MKSVAFAFSIAALAMSGAANAATVVQANSSTPTLLGVFTPGTYTVNTAGIISLTGGNDFLVDADGIPASPVTTSGYGGFNPDGSKTADGNCGPAGCNINIGALAGTFDPTFSTNSFFLLGTNSTFDVTTTSSLFGLVNDTFAPNNTGSFSVALSAVPEPSTWALMVLGFGFAGGAMRLKRRQKLTVRYA